MGIVLHILQIIGIALLILLAVAVFLVIFVLITPLRYKLIVNYDAQDSKEYIGYLNLSWLLSIIRCKVKMGLKGIEYEFRLFGFKSKLLEKLIFNSDKESSEDIEEDIEENIEENKADISNNKEIAQNKAEDKKIEGKCETNDELDIDLEDKDDDLDHTEENLLEDIEDIWEDLVSETDDDNSYEKERKKKFSFKDIFNKDVFNKDNLKKISPVYIIKKIIGFIKGIFKGTKALVKAIYKTIKQIIYKYELAIELWEKKSTQIAIDRLKKYISKLCKHISPRKKKINVRIGFEDPSQTGYFLAGLGVVYGVLGNMLNVNPNFEEEECKIDCVFSGRMNLLTLGIFFIRIVKDKAIKRLLKNIDKLKEDYSNVG